MSEPGPQLSTVARLAVGQRIAGSTPECKGILPLAIITGCKNAPNTSEVRGRSWTEHANFTAQVSSQIDFDHV